jgi:hypothetical protein
LTVPEVTVKKRRLNPLWISGWSYFGKIKLSKLDLELQKQLQKPGDAITIDAGAYYLRYVNNDRHIPSSKEFVIDFYRRFKKRLN